MASYGLDRRRAHEAPTPALRRVMLPLVSLAGLFVGAVLASFSQDLSRPALPESFGWSALQRALEPAPELPLDAEHTDVALVVLCTFRKDRLQSYGSRHPTSPFLGALAERGTTFERAITQAPWTRPSMGSMETGRWPGTLQLDDPEESGISNRALSDSFTTLAERLRAQGYQTLGASGNPNVNTLFGFAQGFNVYREPDGLWRDLSVAPPTASRLITDLLQELDRVPQEKRVFLRLLLVDLHAPRVPDPHALALLRHHLLPARNEGAEDLLLDYEATLRGVDGQLGRLLGELRRRRPNMLFVVTGDHGEGLSFPPHHGLGHGNHLYRTTTDVPLQFYHPALPKPGHRVSGLAMGLDIYPTILGLLGIEPTQELDGMDLSPQVLGRLRNIARRYAFSETWFRRSHKSAVYDENYHLIRDYMTLEDGVPAEELYASSDRLEREDLRRRRPEVVLRLREAILDWEAQVLGHASEQGPTLEVNIGDDDHQRLKVLGYVD